MSLDYRIAGVDYLVTCPPEVTAIAPDAIWADFVAPSPGSGDAIRVDLVVDEMPDLRSWPTLTHGPSGSIRQNDAGRALCIGECSDDRPADLVARWQKDATHAIVHCGPRYLTARPDGVEMGNAASYPVDRLLLMYYLASRQGLILHAAGLTIDGRGLAFPGISGAGKSTLTRQFLARRAAGLLGDDRIIVRLLDGIYQAFGTPWPSDAGVAVNAGAPLAALLFLAKGPENRIRELSPQTALERLLSVTSILWHERELLFSQLDTCERLLRDIPAFELSWSLGTGVVDDLQDFVRRL
jgi:hypothetical protein